MDFAIRSERCCVKSTNLVVDWLVVLTDNPVSTTEPDNTTYASAKFSSQGLSTTTQGTSVSTVTADLDLDVYNRTYRSTSTDSFTIPNPPQNICNVTNVNVTNNTYNSFNSSPNASQNYEGPSCGEPDDDSCPFNWFFYNL